MVKLIETTTFKDKNKEPMVSEKKFSTIHKLYRALDKYGIKNHIKYDLKKTKRCELEFVDANTVLEIIIPIHLTDAPGTMSDIYPDKTPFVKSDIPKYSK